MRANRAAFDRWRLLPRVMRGLRETSTATTVLGQEVALPVLIAPSGLHRLAHDEGELATARAARAAGTIYTMSTAATVTDGESGRRPAPWWFQLYVFIDRGITRALVERAAAAGASALVVTVDVPVLGRREADERNRFALPTGCHGQPPDTRAHADPDRLRRFGTDDVHRGRLGAGIDLGRPRLAGLALAAASHSKGHPPSGRRVRAFDHGAKAVIVSNHGGRQLDSAVASLDALPAVVEAVAGRGEVLLDGGIRRGTDVLKALALGARAVLIGRPVYWGLAVGGEAGVRHILELLRRRAGARPAALRPGQPGGGEPFPARPSGRADGWGAAVMPEDEARSRQRGESCSSQ